MKDGARRRLTLLPGLACLCVLACTRAPHPAAAVAPPPVFPMMGDTSEVLGSIPDPVHHPRPAVVTRDEGASDSATTLPAPESSYDTLRVSPGDTDSADTSAGTSRIAPAPGGTGGTSAGSAGSAPPAAADADWVVQVFAGGERGRAFEQAQRAQKSLGLGDGQVSIRQAGAMWKVCVGSPADHAAADALLARCRPLFPRAFLTHAGPGR